MCLPALMCLNKGDYLVLCITCDFLLAQFNKRMIYILKIVTAAKRYSSSQVCNRKRKNPLCFRCFVDIKHSREYVCRLHI